MSLLTKNTTPNLIAIGLIGISYALPPPAGSVLLAVGLFALSGALTNWLAVHMLFERVPGLYGSGVIPVHFDEFKTGILSLVTRHLFTPEKVEEAFNSHGTSDGLDLTDAIEALDLDRAFDQLVSVILESSFGAMLAMVGGAPALEPMREPFNRRIRAVLVDTSHSPRFQQAVSAQLSKLAGSEKFMQTMLDIVQSRLDELTPEMVRDIVQEMIRKHLGWLVVWGGVFGGLIGLIGSLLL